MRILHTPDDAADGLADYPSQRGYVPVPAGDGKELRVHLVDAGDHDVPPVVFLHGNPSWSYLWRHQISAVVDSGYRAIAPDLVGMGLSDKPSEMADYTVARHVAWMRALLFDVLDLHDLTFVLHDWGGIIGMRLAAEQPERVCRMVISNTGLPWLDITEPLPEVIEASGPLADFQAFAAASPTWEPWRLLSMVMVTEPTSEVVEGYRAPYPDQSLTIGSRAFTQIGAAPFEWRGIPITTGVQPYRFWLLQRLHDDLAAADDAEQMRVREAYRAAGIEPLLDQRTIRRVERVNHLEVRGPLV